MIACPQQALRCRQRRAKARCLRRAPTCLIDMVSELDDNSFRRLRSPPSSRSGAEGAGASPTSQDFLTSPRPGKGLHGITQVSAPLSKSQSLRAVNAFGIGFTNDVDQIPKRGAMAESPGARERTRNQEMQGMPLSGWGADISLVGGRRCRGLSNGRMTSPHEGKQRLGGVSIDHQLARIGMGSQTTASSNYATTSYAWRDGSKGRREAHGDSEHSVQSNSYAHLLGRPDGFGKRPVSNSRSPRGLSPVSPAAAEDQTGVLGEQPVSSEDVNQNGRALIAALRDSPVQNPAVWDAMLSAVTNAQQLFSAKDVEDDKPVLVVQGSQVNNASSAATPTGAPASPSKGFKSHQGSSPRKSSPASETTADSSASPTSASPVSGPGSPGARRFGSPRERRAGSPKLRGPPAEVREQWKSVRRAGWV